MIFGAGLSWSQTPASTEAQKDAALPYSFSNFVWWSDAELRSLLKARVQGLGDQVIPSRAIESRMRDALKSLLEQKGITGSQIQTQEPSPAALRSEPAPGAPPHSVVFSLLSPEVIEDKIIVSAAPGTLGGEIMQSLPASEGREYSEQQNWLFRSDAVLALQRNGYLEADAEISHDAPRKEADRYLVNRIISLRPGPQYRIAKITVDGGPLLSGRDLSSYIKCRPGDIAVPNPFGQLVGQLRGLYWQKGYIDVSISGEPALDREHLLASYQLSVQPGKIYRLRTLTVRNVSPEQEARARELLGIKPGDAFDQMAVSALSRRVAGDALLKDYSFTFSPKEDRANAVVDLALDFFKANGAATVTVH